MTKISIITICRNDLVGLRRTIASVAAQTSPNFEQIVVDGASIDGTLGFLRSEAAFPWLRWTSEPDRGIYDALNKGLGWATGDFVLFLNSGDTLYSPDILATVARELRTDDDVVYGDAIFDLLVPWPHQVRQVCDHKSIEQRNNLCHQATFFRRSLHLQFPYDTRFKILGDQDLLLRLARLHHAKFRKIDYCICHYLVGGISNQSASRERVEGELVLLRWLNGAEPISVRSLLRAMARLLSIRARVGFRRWLGDAWFERLKAGLKLGRNKHLAEAPVRSDTA